MSRNRKQNPHGLKFRYQHSLNTRFSVNFLMFGLVFVLITVITVSIHSYIHIENQYYALSKSVLSALVSDLDTDHLYELYDSRTVDEELRDIQRRYNQIENELHEEGVYELSVVIPVREEETVYYLVDTTYDDAESMPYFVSEYLPKRELSANGYALLYEGTIEFSTMTYLSDRGQIEESIARRITTSDGRPLVVACTVRLGRILKDDFTYLVNIVLEFAIFGFLLVMVFSRSMRKWIVHPIVQIAETAKAFIASGKDHTQKEDTFKNLSIVAKDEIRDLLDSLQVMEGDIHEYIQRITEATKTEERLKTELSVATKIQKDLLPTDFQLFSDIPGMKYYATMRPAKEVGGDFYDFFRMDDTHIAFVICDVAGKGIPAALMMANSMSMIRTRALMGGTPAEILKDVNAQLAQGNTESMFITAWLGILDVTSGALMTANAGHEYPAICHENGAFELIRDRHGLALGAMEMTKYHDEVQQLQDGDVLYLYTDGIPEANNEQKELLGTDRMLQMLNGLKENSLEEILQEMMDGIDQFSGKEPQFDDMTQLMIRYAGQGGDRNVKNLWELLGHDLQEDDGLSKYENLAASEGNLLLTMDASVDQLETLNAYVSSFLEKKAASMKIIMQVQLALEEVFVNVAKYGYPNGTGKVVLYAGTIGPKEGNQGAGLEALQPGEEIDSSRAIAIALIDEGMPYNPLQKETPDLTLPSEERPIGGLGIYLVRKNMDDVQYMYHKACNILVMYKNI